MPPPKNRPESYSPETAFGLGNYIQMGSNGARSLIGFVLALVLLAAITVGQALYGSYQDHLPDTSQTLTLGKSNYDLEVARDGAARERGLSGRSNLDDNSGMLFVFEGDEERCMWMKDVNFNLDIVWLDEERRITQIISDLSSATYPQSFCNDARYVIELPAGTAAEHRLQDGQILRF